MSLSTKAYGTTGSFFGSSLKPMTIERAEPKGDEVLIEILYCGVCHSDLHQVKNDWKNTVYPCVPGHEIVGRVVRTGPAVKRYQTGDIVGVGCMVDSCGTCASCKEDQENYCEGPVSFTGTYNGPMKPDGSNTFGGYSTQITVKEHFVLRIPEGMDVASAAPILCAGVTTWSPLQHWGVKAGDPVGVAGLGGLGHMAVKLAVALGANVTVFTEDKEKEEEARALGAKQVVLSTDKKAMAAVAGTLSFILVTIPDAFDVNPYICALKRDGALVTVGLLAPYKAETDNSEVAKQRKTVSGSLIGGIRETQEVLDFCAKHDIRPEVEMIRMDEINDAFKKMMEREVRFRYVIDMASLKGEE